MLIYLVLIGTIVCFALWSAITRLYDDTGGDASIYWVFAKSMWQYGPFHYGSDGPKNGATSPLWALTLSVIYPFFGDQFVIYKLLTVGVLLLAAFATFRLAVYLTRSIPQALAAGTLLLLFSPLQQFTVQGFETPLFILILVESLHITLCTLRSDVISQRESSTILLKWAALASLLPLARPEGGMFLLLLMIGVIYAYRDHIRRSPRILIIILGATAPSIIFYSAMYMGTGELIPSSIMGRYIRRAQDEIGFQPVEWWRIVLQCAGVIVQPQSFLSYVVALMHGFLFAIGFTSLWRLRRTDLMMLLSIAGSLCLVLLWMNPSFYLQRYASPVVPIGIIIATHGCAEVIKRLVHFGQRFRRPMQLAFGFSSALVVLATLAVPVRSLWLDAQSAITVPTDIVLDRQGSQLLNNILKPSDLVLVYEIQTQYYLKCRTISADGIVGGEILPYLFNGDLKSFIERYHVTYILVSSGFQFRSVYNGTLLQRLGQYDQRLNVGDGVEIDGLILRKIAARQPPEPLPAHWSAVYRVGQSEARQGGGQILSYLSPP